MLRGMADRGRGALRTDSSWEVFGWRRRFIRRRLSVSKKFDTLPGGIPYPLDTPLVPGETSGDTPGFAPLWARVGG